MTVLVSQSSEGSLLADLAGPTELTGVTGGFEANARLGNPGCEQPLAMGVQGLDGLPALGPSTLDDWRGGQTFFRPVQWLVPSGLTMGEAGRDRFVYAGLTRSLMPDGEVYCQLADRR